MWRWAVVLGVVGLGAQVAWAEPTGGSAQDACARMSEQQPDWVKQPGLSCERGFWCAKGTTTIADTDDTAAVQARAEADARKRLLDAQKGAVEAALVDAVGALTCEEDADVVVDLLDRVRQGNPELLAPVLAGAKVFHHWCRPGGRDFHAYLYVKAEEARAAARAQVDVVLQRTIQAKRVREQDAARAAKEKAEREGEVPRRVGAMLDQAWPAGRRTSVCVGPFTYSDSGLPSPLGELIASHVRTALSARDDVRLLGSCQKAEREVRGQFFADDAHLTLFVRVLERKGDRLLAERQDTLPRKRLPAKAEPQVTATALAALNPVVVAPVKPPPAPAAPAPKEAARLRPAAKPAVTAPEPFRVAIEPDKGKGATYRAGQIMIPTIRANRDCYVRVYLHDADGNTIQLFPNAYETDNRLRAGQARKLGHPDNNTFLLRLQAPFGNEILKIVASTRPFDDEAANQRLMAARTHANPFDYQATPEPSAVRDYLTRGIGLVDNRPVVAPSAASAEVPMPANKGAHWAEDTAAYISVRGPR